ncbi:hypothetical protein J2S43_000945 [Catenuloplanes nepalensis]|uniref:Uncharacterized protein n=1 Tax=Catenuloplanes nepalensis TaxID=587533 RepID=A0ABT9MM15_9ACTN|nr:hypothetical protein [Catenuloplanes nepalensis]MDP9792433.1 hypothetical protein [Catenuloplanes nepalensis]
MLAPTRLRLVNVGIERPRFADLIIDLRTNGQPDDTVIKLQNGGGKSTIIAMWLHAYEPHRDKFLAKLAIRHQGKAGEQKKFEHYIPAGSTTYVICEHAIAGVAENLFGMAPRLVVGYAAWRDSEAQDRASELFFCFQTNDALTFDTLPVRGTDGSPMPHTEFLDHLIAAKKSDPTLQLAHTDEQGKWAAELASRGFDLDFLRRFLLQMNLDEGAADRIFTYDSSRTFLNSLINVLADPKDFETVAREITRLRSKIANQEVDEATETFLTAARRFTEPLAVAADRFKKQQTARTAALSQWADTTRLVEQWTATADTATTHVNQVHGAATTARNKADAGQKHLEGQRAALVVRRCEQDVDQAAQGARTAGEEVTTAEGELEAVKGCIQLAQHAVAAQDQQLALDQLQDKVRGAAPLRRDLATTAQLLADRLDGEIAALAQSEGRLEAQEQTDARRLEALNTAITVCSVQESEARADLGKVAEQRAGGKVLRQKLRDDGYLETDESADRAVIRHRQTVEAARGNITSHRRQAVQCDSRAKEATQQAQGLQGDLDTAAHEITTNENTLTDMLRRTDRLTKEVTGSGLVEIDRVDLDEHADIIHADIRSRLDGTRAAARTRAVRVSQLERNVQALHASRLLPARPEVDDLVNQLQQHTGRGVLPGWTWLSRITPDKATSLLRSHPELADGIVVPVEDDFAEVEGWLAANVHSISVPGPVVVACGASFFDGTSGDRRTVVLPDPALWDQQAGQEAVIRVGDELDIALASRDEAETIILTGEHLVRELDRWTSEVGQGSADRLREQIEQQRLARAELAEEQKQLFDDAQDAHEEAEKHREAADEEQARAERAEEAERRVQPLADFDAGAEQRNQIEEDARHRRDQATHNQHEHESERQTIRDRSGGLADQRRELAVHTSELRRRVAGVNDILSAHPGEATEPEPGLLELPRDALDSRLRDLNQQYQGLVTDADLRSRISTAQERMEECSAALGRLSQAAQQQARRMFDQAPHTSLIEWDRADKQTEQRVRALIEARGAAQQRHQAAKTASNTARREKGAQSPLDVQWHSPDLTTTNHHLDEVTQLIATAKEDMAEAKRTLDQATILQNRLTAFASTVKDRLAANLTAAGKSLAQSGKLGQPVNLDDLLWETSASLDTTHPVVTRLRWMNDALEEAKLAVNPLSLAAGLDRFSADDLERFVTSAIEAIEHVGRQHQAAEVQAHALAEKLRECSVNAPGKAAGTIVSRLKSSPLAELIDNATSNDYDASQRLAAVRAELRNFSTELDHSAQVVSTTVESIRSKIRTIASRSKLPTDDRLGVWSGQEFLKIQWSESSRDNRQKLVRDALEAMIRTEDAAGTSTRRRPSREPAPLELLVEAITPNLRAEVLIPKVPFDGKHHPMEEIAMRTSGGEGVTMAVIIAALMLSMRNPSRKEQTFLIIDNIFAKVVEPSLLRLIRQVARGLRVQLILLTASRDPHALSVFSSWVQLKVQEAGPRVLVVPEAAVAADIPRQLRREPLVATTTPVILDTATARISITDSSLGTSDPSNPDVAIDDDVVELA